MWHGSKRTVLAAAGLAGVVTLGSFALPAGSAQQEPLQENVRLFMHAKLTHMQQAIEGLTKEDLGAVAASAQQISLLSQAAQWQVIQTPEYARRSGEFRRTVDALTEAARGGNLDAATLSFVKVTLSCVECHKYVRSVRHVGLGDQGLNPSVDAGSGGR